MTSPVEKRRRMALREVLGTRTVSPLEPKQALAISPYLIAHACFECRKSFKRGSDEAAACPDCGGKLHEMGRSFRVPRREDEEQWRKVQKLFALGFRFFGHGSSESERLPRFLRDVDAFVARNQRHRLRVAVPDLTPLPK